MQELSEGLARQIEEGIRILKQGGIVAYPTDTVYGLGASMDTPGAVERVFAVKSRPRQMAVPVLVSGTPQIQDLAAEIPPAARCLMDAFFPGALTLVLVASSRVPSYLTSQERTIALRVPNHPVPLALIVGIGTGLVGTSANLSGSPSPFTAEEVRRRLGGKIDLIIDGGRSPGTESTIVDVSRKPPAILRSGAISAEEIERVCGKILAEIGE